MLTCFNKKQIALLLSFYTCAINQGADKAKYNVCTGYGQILGWYNIQDLYLI